MTDEPKPETQPQPPCIPAHWTLTAALLWVATRDLGAALEGQRFNTMRAALDIGSPDTGLPPDALNAAWAKTEKALNDARSRLMTACERGELAALGLRTTWQQQPGQRGEISMRDMAQTDRDPTAIPATAWARAGHFLCDHEGRAELRVRTKGGATRTSRLEAWREILLPSADVLRLWPAPSNPCAPEPARPAPSLAADVPHLSPGAPDAAPSASVPETLQSVPGRKGEAPKVQAAFREMFVRDIRVMNHRDWHEKVKAYCSASGGAEVPDRKTVVKHVKNLLAVGRIGKEWEESGNNGKQLK